MGLDAAAPSLGNVIESVRAGLDAALSPWLPQSMLGPSTATEGWSDFAPIELFLLLVVVFGAVLLWCGIFGMTRALLLRTIAHRVEALIGEHEILSPDSLKQEFLRAFRGARRASHAAEAYVGSLKAVAVADGERLIAPQPARESFALEEVLPSVGKRPSDRVLGAIVGLGAVVIVVELVIGLLRFRAQVSDAASSADGLFDPAMAGAIFALGCVLLTAIAVGLYRVILSFGTASLGKLQGAIDAVFYRAASTVASTGPRLSWPAASSPRARLLEETQAKDLPPVLVVEPSAKVAEPILALDLDRPVVVPERGDQMRSTVETENTAVASAEFERTTGEIRALVGTLREDVSNQRETLGEILARMSEPAPALQPPVDLTTFRQSTAELALLADATRESIMQLAQITENLSRVVAVLVEHASEAAMSPSAGPRETTPDVVNELRELLREVQAAETSPGPLGDLYEDESAQENALNERPSRR